LKNLNVTIVKVKKIKAVPLHAKQAEMGGRGIAVPILDHDIRRGWVVSATPYPIYPLPQEKDLVPIVQEAVWASGPVWMGLQNLAPTRV
jgi:hypothetical protein